MFGSCGIVTPLVAFTCTSLAITLSPQFSWTDNALSDLGIVKGATSTLFNTGLILGGILAAAFGLGLFTFLEQNTLGKLGAILFTLAAAALTAIGIFPENARPMHLYASVAFFILLPVAMLSWRQLHFAEKGQKRSTHSARCSVRSSGMGSTIFNPLCPPGSYSRNTLLTLSLRMVNILRI